MIRINYVWLALLIYLLSSCAKISDTKSVIESDYSNYFLANTVQLNIDTTIINMEDYMLNPTIIDSIIVPRGLKYVSSENHKEIYLVSDNSIDPISIIKIFYDHKSFSLKLKKSTKKRISFSFHPQGKKYKSVQIVGDINAWNPANTALSFVDSIWQVSLVLQEGVYQYQMVLDGEWILDENNSEKLSNGIGGWNSKLTVKSKNERVRPIIHTKSFGENQVIIGYNQKQLNFVPLWNNQMIDVNMSPNDVNIIIPKEAKNHERSFIRIIAFNQYTSSNELIVPLEYGIPVSNSNQLNRHDKARNISYFLLADRFMNGDKLNDRPVLNDSIHPTANFYGGDVQGILQKLEDGYFEDLGINTIWLSPIVKNPEGAFGLYNKEGIVSKFSAYHGYWPISFTQIDSRFGDELAFKKLVQLAHQKDMNVFIDFVANHVHENHPIYKKNKDKNWTTNLYLPDGSLNTERWDDHRLTTWFDLFLPTLNLENEEVAEMISDSALYWIDHFDIDGYRHDAAKHVPNSFWRLLTKKVKKYCLEHNKQIVQIGETYGTPELINSYINTGMLDGQFDFNVFDALLQTICKDDVGFDLLTEKLTQSFEYYGVNNLMGYISGNQDRARFMALATGDVRFDEDSKLAGWQRDIQKRTPEAFAKLNIMNSILMTIPGIPVIFYGDEIGMTGGNDPDCRRMMRFDKLSNQEENLKIQLKKVVGLRRSNLAFLYGDFKFLEVKKDVLSYARKYFDQIGIVLINNSNEEKTVEMDIPDHYKINKLKSHDSSQFNLIGNHISSKLKPYSIQILTQ